MATYVASGHWSGGRDSGDGRSRDEEQTGRAWYGTSSVISVDSSAHISYWPFGSNESVRHLLISMIAEQLHPMPHGSVHVCWAAGYVARGRDV